MALDLFRLFGTVAVDTGKAEANLKRVDVAARQTQDALNKSDASARKASAGFSVLGNSLKDLSAFGGKLSLSVTAPITALGVLATQTAVKLDSLKRGLTAVAGSSAAAEAQLSRLKKVAELPGLGFEEAIQGSTVLQAAGLSAEEAERSIKGFGNALATVGKGKADLSGVFNALSQIQSKGKISAEEINQLAERVPQIRQILIGAFGTANTEILQRAGITSKEFVKVVNDELAKLPAVTGGAQNALENFDDTRKRVFGQFGDALLRVIVPAVSRLTPVLERVGNAFAALSPTTQTVIVGVVGLVAAVGPLIVGFASVAGAIATIGGVLGTGGILATLGTVALALGALAAAAFALYRAWQTNFLGIRDITKKAIEGIKAFFSGGWKDALEKAEELAASFVATLEGFWNSIPKDFESAFRKVVDVIRSVGIEILSAITDIGQKIAEFFAGALNKAFDGLGDSLVNKLKGIRERLGSSSQPAAPAPQPGTHSYPGALEGARMGRSIMGPGYAYGGQPSPYRDALSGARAFAFSGGALRSAGQSFADIGESRMAAALSGGLNRSMAQSFADLGESRMAAALGQKAGDSFIETITSTEGFRRWQSAIDAAGGDVFLKRVEQIAQKVGANPADLLGAMAFESGLDPAKRNKSKGSTATGLIQFVEKTAGSLGTSTEALGSMSAIQQLDFVEKYLDQFGRTLDTTEKVYSAILGGRVLSDPNAVLFTDKGSKQNSDPFFANRKLDKNNSGTITLGEAASQITKQGFGTQLSEGLKKTVPAINEVKAALDPIATGMIAIGHESTLIPPKMQAIAQATSQVTSEAQKADEQAKTMARVARQEIAEDLKNVKEELAGIGQNMDLKVNLAQLQAIRDIRKADEDAVLSQIQNRIKLADATVFHAERSKARVLDYLAQESKGFTEIVSDVQIGIIRSTFDSIDSGIAKLTDRMGAFGNVIKDVLSSVIKLTLNKVFMRLFGLEGVGGGAAAGTSTGGGGFNLGSMLTGGFAGGNPAQQALGIPSLPGTGGQSSPLGGILSKIPGIGGLFGGAAKVAPTMVGGLPTFKNLPVSLSGMPNVNVLGKATAGAAAAPGLFASLGASGLLAGGGLLGSLAGGQSQVGRLLGGVGGTLLGGALGASGIFGGGLAGALPAFFSNPITAIIGAGLIGGALISRLFRHDYLKDYRKLIQGEYAVDVKEKSTLETVKSIGQNKYGKAFGKHEIETIRLPDVRELIAEYASSTGQKGNSKLFSAAAIQDPFNAMNIQRREFGGSVLAGMPYLVGERRPELFIPNMSGMIMPSVGGFQSRGIVSNEMMRMFERLAQAVESMEGGARLMARSVSHIDSISPDEMLKRAKPSTVARHFERDLQNRGQSSSNSRRLLNRR